MHNYAENSLWYINPVEKNIQIAAAKGIVLLNSYVDELQYSPQTLNWMVVDKKLQANQQS